MARKGADSGAVQVLSNSYCNNNGGLLESDYSFSIIIISNFFPGFFANYYYHVVIKMGRSSYVVWMTSNFRL